MPKSNNITGAPDDWFDNGILTQNGFLGISFDFFVNWRSSPEAITPYAWIKRILPQAPSSYFIDGQVDEQGLISEIEQSEQKEYLEFYAKFCTEFNLTLQYLLFREVDWEHNPEAIFIVTVSFADNQLYYSIETIDVIELKLRIQAYSGGNVRIGGKGLTYGTSTLECYLSVTDSLYPGDVDCLVFNTKTLKPIVLLEYKKHNLDTHIKDQKLEAYYPVPDGRKYKRLAILRDFIDTSLQIKCVYYPTKKNDFGKLELIEGPSSALRSGKSTLFNLPKAGELNTFSRVALGIINYEATI